MRKNGENEKRERKFRVWTGSRMVYLASKLNDTSLIFSEWGWEAVDHLTGELVSICSSKTEGAVLMEYIGLKIPNESIIYDESKELYEGDVIEDVWKHCYEIRHKEHKYYGHSNRGDDYGNFTKELFKGSLVQSKLLGNIYENPELKELLK